MSYPVVQLGAQAKKYTHTTKGTGELATFTPGATIQIWGAAAVFVGTSKSEAEQNSCGAPALIPIVVKLGSAGTIWIDSNTASIVYLNQVELVS